MRERSRIFADVESRGLCKRLVAPVDAAAVLIVGVRDQSITASGKALSSMVECPLQSVGWLNRPDEAMKQEKAYRLSRRRTRLAPQGTLLVVTRD
jgi:hypothetical protein